MSEFHLLTIDGLLNEHRVIIPPSYHCLDVMSQRKPTCVRLSAFQL